jgi:hypothetical protein
MHIQEQSLIMMSIIDQDLLVNCHVYHNGIITRSIVQCEVEQYF